jgi:tetratricopeptide (TPR) repeat protein
MADPHREEIAKLETLYANNPEGRVFTHLAEAYRKSGELDRAREILEEGLRRHSDYSSAHVVLGRVLTDLGQTDGATSAFRRVLELDRHNLVALRSLGEIATGAGNTEDALLYYRELLSLDPSDERLRTSVRSLEERLESERAAPPAAATERSGLEAASDAPSEPAVSGADAAAAEPPVGTPGEPDAAEVPGLMAGWPTAQDADDEAAGAVAGGERSEDWEADVGIELDALPGDLGALAGEGADEDVAAAASAADLDWSATSDWVEDTAPFDLPGGDLTLDEEPSLAPAEGSAGEDSAGIASLDIELGLLPDDGTATPPHGMPRPEGAGAAETTAADFATPGQPGVPGEAVAAAAETGEPDRPEDQPVEDRPYEAAGVADVWSPEGARSDIEAEPTEPAEVAGPDEPAEVGEPAEAAEAREPVEATAAEEAVGEAPAAAEAPGEPRPAAATWSDAPVDEAAAQAPADPFAPGAYALPAAEAGGEHRGDALVTETMAELYFAQGFYERAAEVYRSLLRVRPGDARLSARLQEAEGMLAAPAPGATEPGDVWLEGVESAWTGGGGVAGGETTPYAWAEVGSEEEPVGPAVGAYFEALLSWRPGGDAAAPTLAESGNGTAWAAAETEAPAVADEEPVAELELGPEMEAPEGEVEGPWGAASVGPPELPEAASAAGADDEAPNEDEDLEMFRSWLQSLKK